MIPSNWLEDFVEGEQNNLDFFCKFTRTKTTLGYLSQAFCHTQEQILLLLFIGADYKMHNSSISFQCQHFMDAQCIEACNVFISI